MEDDEGEIYARTMEATADQFRDAAKVAMDRVPGADDVAAAKLKAEAKACIKMAEYLEETGMRCLTAKIGQSGKPDPVRPPPPSPVRHERQAAPGANVEGIQPFQGTSVKRPLREQLNEQLKRRLKEYYAERERLSPRP